MQLRHAQKAIESLRKGIPPDGMVRYFTVGRRSEFEQLESMLVKQKPKALLIKANYGAGKTHLLRVIREEAFKLGYAVSYIVLDAKAKARFDHFNEIFGAVFRSIELPNSPLRGPRTLFSAILETIQSPRTKKQSEQVNELSNNGKWDYSKALKSPSLYIGLRAWLTAALNANTRELLMEEVETWLCEPWNYQTRRSWLYSSFVASLRAHFRDPRPDWHFNQELFDFKYANYRQSWDALNDLDFLAQVAGLRGLVILADEFEDVIYGLTRADFQMSAFLNLFRMADGAFQGLSFYAVTPGFVNKCKTALLRKGYEDYDYARFDKLPTFEMSPLLVGQLEELAEKVLETHGIAYGWEPDSIMRMSQFREIVRRAAAVQVEDRTRQTIKQMVKSLDELLESSEVSN